MIFDTHAHYDDEQFDTDREDLLDSMAAGGVGTIVNASASPESWDRILELTEKYPFIYGMIGVHPDEVGSLDEEKFGRMEELLGREKIVAVGEIGLDYYWDKEGHDTQKYWFIRQLELAAKKHMPAAVHSREAAADTMEIMKKYGAGMQAVIHAIPIPRRWRGEYVKMGYYIGVGGVVTFKKCAEAEGSRAGGPSGADRPRDGLSLSCAGAVQGKEKFIPEPAVCGAGCRGAEGNFRGRSDPADRRERQETV